MPENPNTRSVKIGADERTGWSSERPRSGGDDSPRPVDITTRCRLLTPSERLQYSPGSLVVIVGPQASEPARFAERVLEERGALLSFDRVRTLLQGRVDPAEIDERASDLLTNAIAKRLSSAQGVALPLVGFDAAEREHYVRLAHRLRRPRHIILLTPPKDEVLEDEQTPLDELRRALDAGELGNEGFQTALRLGGRTLTDLKRIVFQPFRRED